MKTRIRYEVSSESGQFLKSTEKVLIDGDLVDIIIDTLSFSYEIKGEKYHYKGIAKDLNDAKKMAKKHLVSHGIVFEPEVRIRNAKLKGS